MALIALCLLFFNRSLGNTRSTQKRFNCCSSRSCVPVPFAFLSQDLLWGRVVVSGSVFGLILTAAVSVIYVVSWDSSLVRASGRDLSSVMLVGLAVAFASPLTFCFRPTPVVCVARYGRFVSGTASQERGAVQVFHKQKSSFECVTFIESEVDCLKLVAAAEVQDCSSAHDQIK